MNNLIDNQDASTRKAEVRDIPLLIHPDARKGKVKI